MKAVLKHRRSHLIILTSIMCMSLCKTRAQPVDVYIKVGLNGTINNPNKAHIQSFSNRGDGTTTIFENLKNQTGISSFIFFDDHLSDKIALRLGLGAEVLRFSIETSNKTVSWFRKISETEGKVINFSLAASISGELIYNIGKYKFGSGLFLFVGLRNFGEERQEKTIFYKFADNANPPELLDPALIESTTSPSKNLELAGVQLFSSRRISHSLDLGLQVRVALNSVYNLHLTTLELHLIKKL